MRRSLQADPRARWLTSGRSDPPSVLQGLRFHSQVTTRADSTSASSRRRDHRAVRSGEIHAEVGDYRRHSESRFPDASLNPALLADRPALAVLLALVACGSGGGGLDRSRRRRIESPRSRSVEFGLLADVYGLRATSTGTSGRAVSEQDVLVGPDIQDERPANVERSPTTQITLRLPRGRSLTTLQPRLADHADDRNGFERVSTKRLPRSTTSCGRWCSRESFGQNAATQPHSVVAAQRCAYG